MEKRKPIQRKDQRENKTKSKTEDQFDSDSSLYVSEGQ
jgi:hypothetical protein